MSVIDQTITRAIDKALLKEEETRNKEHKSSGKLSASMLSWPLQWQILKSLEVEQKPVDTYTLRKFLRGRTVEDWLVTQIPGIIEKQKFVEYKEVVGYIDVFVDTSNYEFKAGKMPHEIKSVTNAKFSMITKNNAPDEAHCLQACLYALATDSEYFAIDYVASDDLRVFTFVLKTEDYTKKVNEIITAYQAQLLKDEVPVFEPLYAWQKNKMYNNYPEWSELTIEEIKEKVKRLFPHSTLPASITG
jgi:hypothetical protein